MNSKSEVVAMGSAFGATQRLVFISLYNKLTRRSEYISCKIYLCGYCHGDFGSGNYGHLKVFRKEK